MWRSSPANAGGYAMVALLVGISVMAVALSVALPAWSTAARREREAELIFRGQQYARAIMLFQRKNANVFPPSWDVLVQGRFLRKKYKDPMTPDGEFQPVYAGQTLPGQTAQIGQPGQRGQTGAARGQAGGRQAGAPGGGPASQPGASTPTQLEQLAQRTQGIPAARGGIAGGVITGSNPGLIGVVSKSEEMSLQLYNGRDKYNEWVFVATQASTAAGAGGARGGRAGQRVNGPGPTGGVRPGGVNPPIAPVPSPFGTGPRSNTP